MSLVGVPEEAEVVEDVDLSAMSLDELAGRANAEHGMVLQGLSSSLVHARLCGESLLQVRRMVPPGTWESWVDENTDVRHAAAGIYMRIATYWDAVLEGGAQSVYAARTLLQGLPDATQRLPGTPGHIKGTPENKAEAKRLREAGMTLQEVGDVFGVSMSTINCWVNPGSQAKQRAALRAARRRRAEEKKILARERLAAEAKAKGGNISAAYSFIRKAAAEVDAAGSGDVSPYVRRLLRDALTAIYKAEDQIGKAVRNT